MGNRADPCQNQSGFALLSGPLVKKLFHALNRPTTPAITIFNSCGSIGLPRWAW